MNKLNKFLFLSFAAASIISCKKDLDLKPTDTISTDNSFLSVDDLQKGANAIYGRYLNRANTMIVSSLLTDEVKLGPDNSGQGRFTYTYTFSSDPTGGGDVNSIWIGMPTVINQANIVLEYADKVPANGAVEQARIPIIKGQAIAMRALAHFEVLQGYAKKYDAADPLGIPYITSSDISQKPARIPVAQTVARIEADLDAAKALLPAVTVASFSDTVMNQVNITAIQARVALYKRDWQKASDYATTVINSAVKPLANGATYTGIWTDANKSEILFRIRQDAATSTTVGNLYTNGNLVYYAPSDKLTAAYGAGDIRKAAFIATGTVGSSVKTYVNKFFTSSKGPRVLDVKAIRIAEMYLIRAEAQAELGNVTAGTTDLNTLRSNRISGYTNQTFANAADLITAIVDERYKELAFEGFRYFDLKRRSLPVTRLLTDTDNNTTWQILPADNFRFTLPIPQQELLGNKNMVQNPGYN